MQYWGEHDSFHPPQTDGLCNITWRTSLGCSSLKANTSSQRMFCQQFPPCYSKGALAPAGQGRTANGVGQKQVPAHLRFYRSKLNTLDSILLGSTKQWQGGTQHANSKRQKAQVSQLFTFGGFIKSTLKKSVAKSCTSWRLYIDVVVLVKNWSKDHVAVLQSSSHATLSFYA